MDSFEINKIVAAILMVALLIIGISKISDIVFHVEKPETPGYKVELDQPDTFTELIMQCCDEEGVKRSSHMSTFTPGDQHFIDWLLA